MSVRAEIRRELQRAETAIDKVNAHLQKAGSYAIEGKRPELDDALFAMANLLTASKATLASLRESM